MNDDTPIKSIKHPQLTPWWKRVLNIFKKPKFSNTNLEKGALKKEEKIVVVEWIPESETEDKEVAFGGMGGFFQPPMRGQIDFFDEVREEIKPYVEALRKEIIKNNIRITGEEHQNNDDGVPLFSDGKVASFSMRAWGDFMAATWSEEENKDYHYMDFYM